MPAQAARAQLTILLGSIELGGGPNWGFSKPVTVLLLGQQVQLSGI